MTWKIFKFNIAFVIFLLLFNACAGVSILKLNGTTLSPDVKTFSVMNFTDDAGNGTPNINVIFSEKLREYFIRNTRLSMTKSDGDLLFDGSIKSFELSPVAPAANPDGSQQAALQRLTITVNVNYTNKFDENTSFENRDFSFFYDFSSDKTINEVEKEALDIIFGQLSIDVFNATVATW
jgi:hypothetical protein